MLHPRLWFAVALASVVIGACDRPDRTAGMPGEAREPLVPETLFPDADTPAGVADGKQLARKAASEQYRTDIAAAESAYASANEKCDSASALTRDACRAQAKADYEASIVQAHARRDAVEP